MDTPRNVCIMRRCGRVDGHSIRHQIDPTDVAAQDAVKDIAYECLAAADDILHPIRNRIREAKRRMRKAREDLLPTLASLDRKIEETRRRIADLERASRSDRPRITLDGDVVAVTTQTVLRFLRGAKDEVRSLEARIVSAHEPLERLLEEIRSLETEAMGMEDEKRRIMGHYYRLIAG